MIRRPPRSTLSSSSAASDVYKRQAEGGCPETTQIQLAWVLLQVVVGRLDRLRMLIEADGHSQSILSVVSSQLIEVHVLQWAASRFALSADPTTGRVSSPQCTEGYLVPVSYTHLTLPTKRIV
eukprot:TRINITY_DN24182_c0_g1_i3.p1 TRINITY_DN24182_c0_g1~~TRINITY_DN24182_c0_g1_i3.p1  ORF type:complete len:123 (+),score=23.99 TRINITY_DN24182_c0_g1_i3:111-479(+)